MYFSSFENIFCLTLLGYYYVANNVKTLCISSGTLVKMNELVKSIGSRVKLLRLKSHLETVFTGQVT